MASVPFSSLGRGQGCRGRGCCGRCQDDHHYHHDDQGSLHEDRAAGGTSDPPRACRLGLLAPWWGQGTLLVDSKR